MLIFSFKERARDILVKIFSLSSENGIGTSDKTSTPPARTNLFFPNKILSAPISTDCNDESHALFKVKPAIVDGKTNK